MEDKRDSLILSSSRFLFYAIPGAALEPSLSNAQIPMLSIASRAD